MKRLIEKLEVKVIESVHGTIYVFHKGKKIRISDHEPNASLERYRKKNDLEIYTHDVGGKLINSKYEVVERIVEFLGLNIPSLLQKEIDNYHKDRSARNIEMNNNLRSYEEYIRQINMKKELELNSVIEAVKGRERLIVTFYNEAEIESPSLFTGDKKRKKRKSLFNLKFEKEFGFEINWSIVNLIIKGLDKEKENVKRVVNNINYRF